MSGRFQDALQRPMVEYKSRELLLRFAAHYQHLSALPRRTRRTLERRWKCTLSAIALLMTLGPAPAFGGDHAGRAGHAAAHQRRRQVLAHRGDRQCQPNARPHLDCVAGAGALDTIVLPANSQQVQSGRCPPSRRAS